MKFTQIDRITELKPGDYITAIKKLSASEEYLKDHFPRFPVMPGVLMLEAMFQASSWLVRATEEFAHSCVVLREARNVKYADFVQPGQTLVVTAKLHKEDGLQTTLKADGTVDGTIAVSGRIILDRFNLADRYPARAATDALTRRLVRRTFKRLYRPTDLEKVA